MTDPQRMVAELVQTRERRLFGFCVYCAAPCTGLACGSHRDLLRHDPHFYELRLRSSRPEGATP